MDKAWHFPFPVTLETLQAMALELPKYQDFVVVVFINLFSEGIDKMKDTPDMVSFHEEVSDPVKSDFK